MTSKCWVSLVQDKVEDYYWKVDGLTELYSVREVILRIRWRPEDEESSDFDSDDHVADDIDDFWFFLCIYFLLYV